MLKWLFKLSSSSFQRFFMRSYVWFVLKGEDGIFQVLKILEKELSVCMALCGEFYTTVPLANFHKYVIKNRFVIRGSLFLKTEDGMRSNNVTSLE